MSESMAKHSRCPDLPAIASSLDKHAVRTEAHLSRIGTNISDLFLDLESKLWPNGYLNAADSSDDEHPEMLMFHSDRNLPPDLPLRHQVPDESVAPPRS